MAGNGPARRESLGRVSARFRCARVVTRDGHVIVPRVRGDERLTAVTSGNTVREADRGGKKHEKKRETWGRITEVTGRIVRRDIPVCSWVICL